MRQHDTESLDAAIDRVIEGMVDAPPPRLDVPFDSRAPILATRWWVWPAPAAALLVLVLVVAAAVWLQRPPGVDVPPLLPSSRLVADPVGLRGAIVPVRPAIEESAPVPSREPRETALDVEVAIAVPAVFDGGPEALVVEALVLAPIEMPPLTLVELTVDEIEVLPLVVPFADMKE